MFNAHTLIVWEPLTIFTVLCFELFLLRGIIVAHARELIVSAWGYPEPRCVKSAERRIMAQRLSPQRGIGGTYCIRPLLHVQHLTACLRFACAPADLALQCAACSGSGMMYAKIRSSRISRSLSWKR